jgi:hypothetical protein
MRKAQRKKIRTNNARPRSWFERAAQIFLMNKTLIACFGKFAAVAAYRTRGSSLLHLILTVHANTKRDFCDRGAFSVQTVRYAILAPIVGRPASTPYAPPTVEQFTVNDWRPSGIGESGHISSTANAAEMFAAIEEFRRLCGAAQQ